MTPPGQEVNSRKPLLRVKVGGTRSFFDACYVYVIVLPGQFQKLGHSENPVKRRDELQEELGGDGLLIVTQIQAFHNRGEAAVYENRLHKRYTPHRIKPPVYARPGSREYYSPDAEILL